MKPTAGRGLTASGNKVESSSGLAKRNGKRDWPRSAAGKDSKKARILIVEHNAFVREGISSLIDGQPDLCCCGEVDCLASTPAAVVKYKPDLVVMELRFKDGDGFELMNSLSLRHSRPVILVLSQCEEVLYAERALQAGAKGYVMKVEAADELLNAIRTVLQRQIYLSPAMRERLVQRVLKPGLKVDGQDAHKKF